MLVREERQVPINGDQPNGHPPPNGTYTVDPDCTGTFLNKLNNLVVLDGGKRYLLLAVSPGTIVTEEGTRIDEGEE